jgi:hypothetical protein
MPSTTKQAAAQSVSQLAGRWIESGHHPSTSGYDWRLVVPIADGQRYLATGRFHGYDYDGQQWQQTETMPIEMEQTSGCTLTALKDGGALAVGVSTGGNEDMQGTPNRVFSAVYRPGPRRWESVTELLWRRQYHDALMMDDSGAVLVAGGCYLESEGMPRVGLATAEWYDPANATWNEMPPMSNRRAGLAIALCARSVALAVGGATELMGEGLATAEIVEFGGSHSKWLEAPPMKSARAFPSAVTLEDSRVVVAGDGDTIEVFDSIKMQWEPPVQALHELGAKPVMVMLLDGTVLIGYDQIYDPVSRTCKPVTPRPSRRPWGGACPTPTGGAMTLCLDDPTAYRFEL